MEQRTLKRCPIGIQTFEEIVNKDYLYIDKTGYVYQLAHGASKYCFLSRPRLFGKSLLVSTLRSYFSGKRELFKGLAMEKLETEWVEYPVLHFDMSTAKCLDKDTLEQFLIRQIEENEKTYGVKGEGKYANMRLMDLIRNVYQQTGRQVVLLIDGYDTPLLYVRNEECDLPALRDVLLDFFSPIKACDPYLYFMFMTGMTKFANLSMSGTLNNMQNISMSKSYAAICGITREEMQEQMPMYIERLADALNLSVEETLQKMKETYGGYHFTWPSPDIYNPFSLLNAFANNELNNCRFGSGTPTYLIEMLRKFRVSPSQLGYPMQAMATSFDAPIERMTTIVPLLYQSGYITIKDYDKWSELYTLDIPNREIRVGLMQILARRAIG